MFTEQQLQDLQAPLAREHVKQRQGAGRQALPFVEGWQVIEEANRIFGFGNWSRETVLLEPLHEPKLVPDEDACHRCGQGTGAVCNRGQADSRDGGWL